MIVKNLNGPGHKITLKFRKGLLTAFYYEMEQGEWVFKQAASDVCSAQDEYQHSLKRILEKLEALTGLEFIKPSDVESQNEPNRKVTQ
jgi:hypothetical protein